MALPAFAIGVLGSIAGAVALGAVEIGAHLIGSDKPLTKKELKKEIGLQFEKQGTKALNKSGLSF